MKTLARLSDITERSTTSYHHRVSASSRVFPSSSPHRTLFGIGAAIQKNPTPVGPRSHGRIAATDCRVRERATRCPLVPLSHDADTALLGDKHHSRYRRTKAAYERRGDGDGDVHLRDHISSQLHSLSR